MLNANIKKLRLPKGNLFFCPIFLFRMNLNKQICVLRRFKQLYTARYTMYPLSIYSAAGQRGGA